MITLVPKRVMALQHRSLFLCQDPGKKSILIRIRLHVIE